MVGVCVRLPALLKPGMLVRGVVDNQVHKDPHAHLMCAVQHLSEEIQVAVIGMDVHVVRDVIAEVRIRRRIDRRKPDRIDPEAFDVVQLLQHPVQVSDAVTVSVVETADPDLVNHHLSVPLRFCQRCHLPSCAAPRPTGDRALFLWLKCITKPSLFATVPGKKELKKRIDIPPSLMVSSLG